MTSMQTKLQQYTNNSNYSDIIQIKNNKELNKLSKLTKINSFSQSSNLNKTLQFPSKEIKFNKLSINSSLNPPSSNTDKNISLNEEILHLKKEVSDFLINSDSQKAEDENEPIFNDYILIKNRKNQTIDKIKNINIRIKINKLKIEEIQSKLTNLKEEKKQKQADIVNLLSNKESIEEIYTNQTYMLTNHLSGNANNNNIFNENNILNNDINNLTNISIKNDMNDNSTINLNSMHNITIIDNEILNNDEDNFKISLNEIKESSQSIYIKQVKNMFEEIFKKRDDKINSSIDGIINNSYELYINNNSEENTNENDELVVDNFFTKISLFLFNHSLGKYSESKINLFLRYLMKINSINVKLTKYLKFVNKKYKDEKKNLNDMINFLKKKNINLVDKKNKLENIIKEYDERLEFFGNNETEANFEGNDTLEQNGIKSDENHSNNNLKAKRVNENLENNNTDELNDVIRTYYDDEDDLNDKYFQKASQKNNNKKIVLSNNIKNNPVRNDPNLTIERESNNKKKIIHINTFNHSTNLRNKNFQLGTNNFNNASKNIISDNAIFPTNQNLTNDEEKELAKKMSSLEIEHYNRVQRIMNASPNVSNFFGVNNYNPKTHTYKPITPNIDSSSIGDSNNKINKTIKYGSRKNHNFISIINMTKTVPSKKDNETEIAKTKEKLIRKNRENGNDSSIKIINLEENFLNEISIKNETENKNNESTSITKSNNVESNTNSKLINLSHGSKNNDNNKNNNININENIKNDDNINIFSNVNVNKNISNEINKDQRRFINITNSKEVDKGKSNSSINVINNKDNKRDNIKTKKENLDLINNNNNIKTLEIQKSRDLNLNNIKNNKLSVKPKKNISKKLFPKKEDIQKAKTIDSNNKDNKKSALSNKNQLRAKPHITSNLTKINTQKKSSNFSSQKMNESNSFANINEKSLKSSINLIEYQSQENNQKYIIKKLNTNIKKSPVKSFINKRNYNSNTYGGNIKYGFKSK